VSPEPPRSAHAASTLPSPFTVLPSTVPSNTVAADADAADPPDAASTLHERSAPPTTATTNGKIELLDSGEWHGLSEAQRLKWQGMFAAMSIPDQLDRAAAWLIAHPEDRAAYARGERGGNEGYLIRWLLREDKGRPVPATH